MSKQGFRKQHNISLTEEEETILQSVRLKHPKISLAAMVMATAKALNTDDETAIQQEE